MIRINEVEQFLGISKANIRFYEKQGLLSPSRSENKYREYGDKDIQRLKQIIILRKLGIPVQEIKGILDGKVSLQEAMQTNIAQLEDQIESLNGALQLSRQIEKEQAEQLDTEHYWRVIHEKEQQGERFVDIMADYWSLFSPILYRKFHIDPEKGVKKGIGKFLLICFLFALWATFVLKAGSFWENFFHWPIVVLAVLAITLPIFLLGRKHPKAASWIASALLILCVGLLVLLFLFIIVLILNSIFHFWY